MILIGGSLSPGDAGVEETWSLSADRGWRNVSGAGSPAFGDAAVLHTPSRRVWSFVLGVISLFDPEARTWTLLDVDDGPGELIGPRVAYDSQSDRIILFGGLGSTYSDETWAFDPAAEAWERMTPALSPPARNFHPMAYDEQSDRVILFGGGTDTENFADTWAYDFEADVWEEISTAEQPTASSYGAMVYDVGTDRTILFGGTYGTFLAEEALAESWAFDYEGSTWTNLAPSSAPAARGWHAMAREADTGQILLFGGGPLRQEFTNELWGHDPETNMWQPLDVE
jgi:hypothetical protein